MGNHAECECAAYWARRWKSRLSNAPTPDMAALTSAGPTLCNGIASNERQTERKGFQKSSKMKVENIAGSVFF